MFYIFDDNLDTFITFERGQELEYVYYLLNNHYNKYEFDSIEFNEKLKEIKILNKKRKNKLNNRWNINNINRNKKSKLL